MAFSFENTLRGGHETPEEEAEDYIPELENPARRLLGLLRERIDKKEYDSVLGDDADGRIPTLLLGNAIKEIYGEEKKLEIVFVQGGTLLWKEPEHADEVKAYLERMRDKLGTRTLIVTEEILAGHSSENLALILRSLGIEADVATFSAAEPEEIRGDLEGYRATTRAGVKIYIGEWAGMSVPREYSGLLNSTRSGEGHATAKRQMGDIERRRMQAAREVTKRSAHKLALEYSAAPKTEKE